MKSKKLCEKQLLLNFLYFSLICNCGVCLADSSPSDRILTKLADEGAAAVVEAVITEGLQAFTSSVIEKGVKFVQNNEQAKDYLKTGLDIVKALDLDQAAVDDCHFSCPSKPEGIPGRMFRNIHHRPSSNGCGSYGIHFDDPDLPAVTSCCDAHDFCYDECGHKKLECDARFSHCLSEACEKEPASVSTGLEKGERRPREDCALLVEGLQLAVASLGCQSFLNAQKEACVCV